MAPSNGEELTKMLKLSTKINNQPSAIRFPRGDSELETIKSIHKIENIEIGKGKIIKEGQDVVILSYGSILSNALKADKILQEKYKLNITIIDARFCKPIDEDLIRDAAKNHKILITLEEGVIGGFSAIINNFLIKEGLINSVKVDNIFMKDEFIDQGSIDSMHHQSEIGSNNIVQKIIKIMSQIRG